MRQVELVERAGDVEVGVGVEAVDERLALVAQVALDLKLHVEVVGLAVRGVLFPPAEFAVHRGVGDVGDVGHHARDREADARAAALRIVAAVPVGVLHDGLPADLVEGDGLRAFPRRGGHGEHAPGEQRKLDREEQRRHAAHRAADDGMERGDAEVVEQELLRAHHVEDGDEGETDAIGPAGGGIGRGRAAGADAAAEDVGADHEEAGGVHGLARADQVVPPAGLAVLGRVHPGAVVVAAERMADEDGVVARGVELTVRLVAQGEAGEHLAALEGERLRADKVPRRDEAGLAGREGAEDGLVFLVVGHTRGGMIGAAMDVRRPGARQAPRLSL